MGEKMKFIFKICFVVIIWSVIISWMIGVSILFELINLDVVVSIPKDYYTHPVGDPDIMTLIYFLFPVLIGLALSMKLFEKELMKEGVELEMKELNKIKIGEKKYPYSLGIDGSIIIDLKKYRKDNQERR